MIKIAALLGDYWHNADDAKAGLEAAVERLADKSEIEVEYITHEQVSRALDHKPDLVINAKMDQLNPRDEQVTTWLTAELDQKLTEYVEKGGSVLAWHAGLAGYDTESNYIHMLRGYFDYHPPGLQDVTYIVNEQQTFSLADEQYFVQVKEADTEIDLRSTGIEGDSLAGWKHRYGKGKVCCFTPAHTREGMLNEHISNLLAEKISWALTD